MEVMPLSWQADISCRLQVMEVSCLLWSSMALACANCSSQSESTSAGFMLARLYGNNYRY